MTLLLTYRQDGEKGPTMESKLYLAYGSNLNLRQMAHRCPGAELLGYTYLENTRLIYRGSLSGYYLSIEDAAGCRVPCGVFRITPRDERNLDRYEGYPNFYGKVTYKGLPLYAMDGTLRPGSIDAMAYRLPCSSPAGLPIPYYIRICREGYLDFGFDPSYLDQALTATKEEMCK